MILFALFIIPIVIAVFSFIFLKGITLKEFLIQLAVQVCVFGIVVGIISCHNLYYTEILNGQVVKKTRERVSCRHSYQCHCYTTCSGSGKNQSCTKHCQTCYDHRYDIDWNIYDSTDHVFNIDTEDRQGLIEPKKWTKAAVGDPTARTHQYKNYIKASSATLFQKTGLVEKFKKVLPDYPSNVYNYYELNRIITIGYTLKDSDRWNRQLSFTNGLVGAHKQCNTILVITKNQPREYKGALEQHWLGANKNDIVLIVNIDDEENIDWVDIIALTKTSLFQHELIDSIVVIKKLDIRKILDQLQYNIVENYKRKRMRDFEYLQSTIVPTQLQFIISLIISISIAVGLTIFFEIQDVA